MNRPLRIVHIAGNAHAGPWLDTLLCGLRDRGHDVALVSPDEGPLTTRIRAHGICTHIQPFPRRIRNANEALRYLTGAVRFLRAFRADVVHNHLLPANIWGRVAAWLARVPVRVTQWPGPLPLEDSNARRMELVTVWMDNGVIAACRATQSFFQHHRHTRNRTHLIYYGFPPHPFQPDIDGAAARAELGLTAEDLVFTLTAYIYPFFFPWPANRGDPPSHWLKTIGLKGHEVFILAAIAVRKQYPRARFLIVGDVLAPSAEGFAYRDRLHRMVHELGLQEYVRFIGARSDIPRVLSATDISVVPSLSENCGGAVEPLLMEKPVVASHVGGLPDVVKDGETGLLTPPYDPDALAANLIRMAALSPAERRAMGQRGRLLVQSLFDPDHTLTQTENLYDQLRGDRA
jgi:glycosyltransferase involved in cell wall biosynthesis